MIDKSQIKRLIVQCELATPDGDDLVAYDVRLARFAKACYQQGREDMHSDVMTEFHKPYECGQQQWIKRIEGLK